MTWRRPGRRRRPRCAPGGRRPGRAFGRPSRRPVRPRGRRRVRARALCALTPSRVLGTSCRTRGAMRFHRVPVCAGARARGLEPPVAGRRRAAPAVTARRRGPSPPVGIPCPALAAPAHSAPACDRARAGRACSRAQPGGSTSPPGCPAAKPALRKECTQVHESMSAHLERFGPQPPELEPEQPRFGKSRPFAGSPTFTLQLRFPFASQLRRIQAQCRPP
jgi:hypothetical protein